MIRADVLILGAGPAGAVAALNLAPTRRVVLVERRDQPAPRIGESLPPAARRLLSDMGLFDEFVAQRYAPSYGNRSIWGQTAPLEIDFLHDPDGHGWHLDRTRFDMWLREMAVARGAILLTPAWLRAVEQDRDWRVRIATPRGEQTVSAAFALDAGGPAAPLGRRIGARRRMGGDRLVCRWLHGSGRPIGRGAGLTVVEAVEEGWWYTAPVPDGRRVLAFFTDIDLMPTPIAHDISCLVDFAAATREVASILAEAEFQPISCGFTAAHSAVLEPCGGAGWLAAGDATMSFDPLSSQGLVHAFFTGLAAAEAAHSCLVGAAHSCLVGDDDAVPRYLQMMNSVQWTYRRHRDFYYASETRWPSAPFWQRRQNSKD